METQDDVLMKYKPADHDRTGSIIYSGHTDRFGNWYIRKDNNTNRSNSSMRYARGSSDYSTNWTNRANLTYNYFHEVF